MSGGEFFVYILQCENGNYYTGYTDDVARRFAVHKSGAKDGAKFTRSFKPTRIAAVWKISGGKSAAMKVEWFIKKRDRRVKERYVNDPPSLKDEFIKITGTTLDILPETAA